ncbi:hypothetical protein WJX82_011298 [Trebouxia sp. C0006]
MAQPDNGSLSPNWMGASAVIFGQESSIKSLRFYSGTRGERLEIADGRDIENEAAAATVTAEENNEQPAKDSDTSSSIDSD